MQLQNLRSRSALHLPATRQRNVGLHENQSETLISSLIFPQSSKCRALGKLFKSVALAAALTAFAAPQVLSPQIAHAKQSAKSDKPVGTWGRTTASATYLRIRPGTQTPIVAKVAKGTQLMVWGTFDGWYRVETTDNKFGWVLHSLVNVPNAGKLKTLSHAKAKEASDRTGHQTLYGSPEVLKKYYATYKAPGAKIGLAMQGIRVDGQKPAPKVVAKPQPKPVVKTVSAPALPREVTITTAEPEAKPVSATVVTPVVRQTPSAKPVSKPVSATVIASRKSSPRAAAKAPAKRTPVMATTIEPMSPSKLPQITPADIMNARRDHLQKQLASRHKTRPTVMKSSPDSTIKTAPAAKPVPGAKTAKVQPTSATETPAAEVEVADAEILGDAYYQSSAKKVPSRGGSPRDYARAAQKNGTLGSGIANQALSYRGMPYIRGASSPSRGFDCSGLIYFLLRQRGYNPPRTAAGLSKYGTPVARNDLQTGDLVFFANTYKRGISHIGIYTGNNNFVHAANRRSGVKTDSLSSPYYSKKYHSARRVPAK